MWREKTVNKNIILHFLPTKITMSFNSSNTGSISPGSNTNEHIMNIPKKTSHTLINEDCFLVAFHFVHRF